MEITFGTFIDRGSIENGDYFYVYFKVHAHVYPGQKEIISGPPERCQPGTAPEVEFDHFEVEEFECGLHIPFNKNGTPSIKWYYSPEEFELLAKLHPETASNLDWGKLEEDAILKMCEEDEWLAEEADAKYDRKEYW